MNMKNSRIQPFAQKGSLVVWIIVVVLLAGLAALVGASKLKGLPPVNNLQSSNKQIVWSASQGRITWDQGFDACSNLPIKGTWRLPSKEELSKALTDHPIDKTSASTSTTSDQFVNTDSYWSDAGYSHDPSNVGAYSVGIGTSGVFTDYYAKGRKFLVRCVQ